MAKSKQNNRPRVLVDLDRTLLDTNLFVDELWQAIAREYKIDAKQEKLRAKTFYKHQGNWYDYLFFEHIASIAAVDSDRAEFLRRIKQHLSINFLFEDAEATLDLYDEIITFGNRPYQELKLAVCQQLTDMPATIIQQAKADYIARHYQEPLVLIDDKPLSLELPDWVKFIMIDRTQSTAVIQHNPRFTSVSSLNELRSLL